MLKVSSDVSFAMHILTRVCRDQAIVEASCQNGEGAHCKFWRCIITCPVVAFDAVKIMHSDGVWEFPQGENKSIAWQAIEVAISGHGVYHEKYSIDRT